MAPLDRVLERLAGVRPSGAGQVAQCPAHDDAHQSLSITAGDDGRVLLKCHRGCSAEAVVTAMGLTMADLFPPTATPAKPARASKPPKTFGPVVARYDYRDESGVLLYQAQRHDPKEFSQRRPDPDRPGGWINSVMGVRHVLYRLPELLAADPAATVYVVEGEKDVENLRTRGCVAVCNVGGAGKWEQGYAAALTGRQVAILPDNDDAGIAHADKVARSLHGAAASVRVVPLPGLGPLLPKHGKDVSDWLALGHTVEELADLVAATSLFDPTAPPIVLSELMAQRRRDDSDPRPWIDSKEQDLPVISRAAWAAIEQGNQPPRLFRFGGALVRLRHGADDIPMTEPIDKEILAFELARCARFFEESRKRGETVRTQVDPPDRVVRDMIVTTDPPLPRLHRIVEAPVFAKDGSLPSEAGYHAGSLTLFLPRAGRQALINVPDRPTTAHVEEAKRLIFDELVVDFPFTSQADRCHAAALLIQPLIRNLIDGPTPLWAVEAASAGSGKSLLVDVLLTPTVGRQLETMSEARGEDEWRKRITSALMEARAVVLLDNVRERISSSTLAAVLTSVRWNDRMLGRNETVSLPNRAIWVATGNNLSYSTEIIRRTVLVRIVPRHDRPWLRKSERFKHPQLRPWVHEHQAELLWAGCVLVRHWFAEGQPRWRGDGLGSFEEWSAITGGILEAAGIEGFLTNRIELYEESDTEGAALRAFIAAWADQHRENPVTMKELYGVATELGCFDLGKGSEQSQKVTLGKILHRTRDLIVGDWLVTNTDRKVKNALQWQLRATAAGESGESNESGESPAPYARARAIRPADGTDLPIFSAVPVDSNTHQTRQTHPDSPGEVF